MVVVVVVVVVLVVVVVVVVVVVAVVVVYSRGGGGGCSSGGSSSINTSASDSNVYLEPLPHPGNKTLQEDYCALLGGHPLIYSVGWGSLATSRKSSAGKDDRNSGFNEEADLP